MTNSTEPFPLGQGSYNRYLEEHFWFSYEGDRIFLEVGPNTVFPPEPRVAEADVRLGFVDDCVFLNRHRPQAYLQIGFLQWTLSDGDYPNIMATDRVELPQLPLDWGSNPYNTPWTQKNLLLPLSATRMTQVGPGAYELEFTLRYIDDDFVGNQGINNLILDNFRQEASPLGFERLTGVVTPEPTAGALWAGALFGFTCFRRVTGQRAGRR